MKLKHIAFKSIFGAALAAVTLSAALPAAAADYGRGYDRGYERNYGRGPITIEGSGYGFVVTPRDRVYRTLVRDYGFEPGLTYHYTDRCNRAGCNVLVFDGDGPPIDRMFAPRLGYGADWRAVGRRVNTHDRRDRENRWGGGWRR